jgi:geranylgeranyl reductase family protein
MKTIEREVIVVGAGPAGSTCASYLSRAGIDVLLLDAEKWPCDKPCGDSQAEVTMSHVRELGGFDEVKKVGYPNKGLLLTSPSHEKCCLPASGERFTTPRRIFDNIIKDLAIRHGAEFLEECWVYDVIKEDGFVKGVKAKYQGEYVEFRSKLVIGADGAHSKVAKAIGQFPDDPASVAVVGRCYFEYVPMEGYLEIHFDKNVLPGYVWIFPSGKDPVTNVGLGFNAELYLKEQMKGRTLEDFLQIFIENNPHGERLKNARKIGPWKGWRIPSGPQAMDNYASGVMLIGDAGSMVLPLTGEGIGPAMETAKMAADTAMEALVAGDFSAGFLKRYSDKRHSMYDAKYQSIKTLENAFRSPETINGFVHKFNTDDTFKQQVVSQMLFSEAKK